MITPIYYRGIARRKIVGGNLLGIKLHQPRRQDKGGSPRCHEECSARHTEGGPWKGEGTRPGRWKLCLGGGQVGAGGSALAGERARACV